MHSIFVTEDTHRPPMRIESFCLRPSWVLSVLYRSAQRESEYQFAHLRDQTAPIDPPRRGVRFRFPS